MIISYLEGLILDFDGVFTEQSIIYKFKIMKRP